MSGHWKVPGSDQLFLLEKNIKIQEIRLGINSLYFTVWHSIRNFLVDEPVYSYPASRGYIFAVWAGVRKVASADNRSIFYRACAKFVTRFASNWFVKSAWVSRENYLRTTLLELLFCFSASPLLVLTILAAKFPRIVFFRKVFLCYQL